MKAEPVLSRVLYGNAACVVVNKLSGEAVEGARGSAENLPQKLAEVLRTHTPFPSAVHRIDVPVTGCVLFALTSEASVFLNTAFVEEPSSVTKKYWAIVEKPSFFPPLNGELVHWIETNSQRNKSYAHDEESPSRKKAVLRYRIAGEGRNYFFVTVELLTGRHHQIRAQLAAVGLHIKGDLKYGAKRSEKSGGIRLHARSLSFPDPLNKQERIRVIADPPVMDNLWEAFRDIESGKNFTTNSTNKNE
ncbi:MAG: RNA pseudouridine synthase [Treponema sp.]|jgi:23S rRNA pseudouridine1911/1915/1917 synthase|nr:RNA pseudouridine synthase [Treponema sp.]